MRGEREGQIFVLLDAAHPSLAVSTHLFGKRRKGGKKRGRGKKKKEISFVCSLSSLCREEGEKKEKGGGDSRSKQSIIFFSLFCSALRVKARKKRKRGERGEDVAETSCGMRKKRKEM